MKLVIEHHYLYYTDSMSCIMIIISGRPEIHAPRDRGPCLYQNEKNYIVIQLN